MNKYSISALILGIGVFIGILIKFLVLDGEPVGAKNLFSSAIGGLVAGVFYYWLQKRRRS